MSDPKHGRYVPLPGSEKKPLRGGRKAGTVDPNERVEVSVYLRPKTASAAAEDFSAQAGQQRKLLTREELAAAQGADPAEMAQVEAFARAHDLAVVEADPARRLIRLAGTATAMSAAFQVQLARVKHPEGTFRTRTGAIKVPAALVPIIEGVFGLDNRPTARAHFRPALTKAGGIAPRNAVGTSYSPPQIAQLYDFPMGVDGSGQTIAIIELGGGNKSSDLTTYFKEIKVKKPQVTSVGVDGGYNKPTGDPSGPDGEVLLDIEVAGAVAPGAHLVVYFAPNTDQGFIDAITKAVHDTTYKPSIMSISWGQAETGWTAQSMQAMDAAFQSAAAVGMTIFVAAGDNGADDNGADDNASDGLAHVDYPASSLYVIGCGGTNLVGSGTTITSETVWNEPSGGATGGGVSERNALPAWQASAGVPPSANPGHKPGRGVPDVAGDADPNTGYQVRVDGQDTVYGGTSAVAPLWAGLLALINQQLTQPAGFLNPVLYQQQVAFHDITSGNNITSDSPYGYSAGGGWDACTGLGSPDGAKLLAALAPIIGKVPAPVGAGVN